MADIIPGIYDREFEEQRNKIALVASFVDSVQIDFSDGTFVPNQSGMDIEKFQEITTEYPHLLFEAHLMVASPGKYVKSLSDAGFRRIIAHVESSDPRSFLEEAMLETIEAGLAVDGPTPLEDIEPFLEEIDVVLVMMSEAGASGLPLQMENVEKIRVIREHYPNLPIEVDEGINPETAKIVKDAGATRLVTTSYIFKNSGNVGSAIEALRNA